MADSESICNLAKGDLVVRVLV